MESATSESSRASTAPFRYDAFISYRHVEPDRKWAKWLHTALETYRVPKSVVREQGAPPRLSRVFRDEDELPASSDLNDQIEQALQSSRFLIVICSPRTPQSLWVNKEVERFRELGRHDRILALLIEGEPAESFPRALREIRRSVVDPTGAAREQIEEVEPLAADVRPIRRESQRHLARLARLRLMACILDVRFDDLRQREQERRARRLTYLSAAGIVLTLLMATLAVAAVLQRNEARRQRAIAEESTRKETVARKQAQRRLAESLVAQANVYTTTSRFREAQRACRDAHAAFVDGGENAFAADLALWNLRCHAPLPLNLANPPKTFGGGAAAISPDGATAVALNERKTLAIWDLRTGQTRHELDSGGATAYDAAFSPDGSLVISAHVDGKVRLWDARSARLQTTFEGHQGNVRTVAFFPDGLRAVSGGDDQTLHVWDINRRELVGTLRKHAAPVFCVATGGKFMLSGDESGRVLLWDMLEHKVETLHEAGNGLLGVAVSQNGRFAATHALDETVIWNLATRQRERTLASNRLRTRAAFEAGTRLARFAFTSDAENVIYPSELDAVVQFIPRGLANRTFAGHESAVDSCLLAAGDLLAMTSGRDRKLLLWPVKAERHSRRLRHGSRLFSVAISKDASMIVTAGDSMPTTVWDTFTGKQLRTVGAGSNAIVSAAISSDNKHVLVGGMNGTRLFELDSDKSVDLAESSPANCVAISPDGQYVLAAQKDSTLKVWDRGTGQLRQTFAGHKDSAIGVAFAPDSRWFVSCGADGAVLRWNVDSAVPLGKYIGNQTRVRAVAVSADGSRVACGADDGTLRVWDAASAKLLLTIAADLTAVCGVAFAPDGRIIYTAGADKSLRAWDASSGEEWLSITGFDAPMWSVAIGGDGQVCVAGSDDGYATISDFSAAAAERELSPRVALCAVKLTQSPDDADSLAVMGQWYALNGIWPWAVDYLTQAEGAGAKVSPILLARCHWLSGNRAAARAGFEKAMAAKEADETYLKLCIQAVDSDR